MSNVPPETGTATGPVFTLASFQKRVLAFLVDWAIGFVICLIGVVLGSAADSEIIIVVFYVLSFVFFIYNCYRQGVMGQTIGKGVLGIRLVRETDAKLTGPGVSIGRGLLHFIDGAVCYIGYLLPLWDAKRQTIADKLVQTVVIEA